MHSLIIPIIVEYNLQWFDKVNLNVNNKNNISTCLCDFRDELSCASKLFVHFQSSTPLSQPPTAPLFSLTFKPPLPKVARARLQAHFTAFTAQSIPYCLIHYIFKITIKSKLCLSPCKIYIIFVTLNSQRNLTCIYIPADCWKALAIG